MVGKVTELLEYGARGEGDNETFVVVRCGRGRSDDKSVVEDCGRRPFDVVVRRYCLHFGSNGSDDVTFDPAGAEDSGLFLFDGLGNGVGILFCSRAFTDADNAVAVDQDELPRRVIVAEDTHDVDVTHGEHFVEECAVAGGAHREGAVVAVLNCGVLLVVIGSVVNRECALAAFGEAHVAEAHQTALIGAEHFGSLLRDGSEARELEGVDSSAVGETVEFGSLSEPFGREERNLPGGAVGVPRLGSYLLEAGVLTNVHTGDIENNFLAHAVVEVEVISVDRECHSGGAVVDNKTLEHVAFFVRRNHAATDNESLVGIFGVIDTVGIIGIVAPKPGF